MNKDGTPRKTGSGRTKGATSLVSIKMSELAKAIDGDDLVVVGRRWLRELGLEEGSSKAISAPLTETEKAGIRIVEI